MRGGGSGGRCRPCDETEGTGIIVDDEQVAVLELPHFGVTMIDADLFGRRIERTEPGKIKKEADAPPFSCDVNAICRPKHLATGNDRTRARDLTERLHEKDSCGNGG
jgi:hypothetical protein